jgi:putative sterol carrier protein
MVEVYVATKALFQQLQQRMDANGDKLAGIRAVYQFNIGGSDPGTYHVVIADGKGNVYEGVHGSPTATVWIASEDMEAIIAGQLNPMLALMRGKLKMQGDLRAAMKLQELLR